MYPTMGPKDKRHLFNIHYNLEMLKLAPYDHCQSTLKFFLFLTLDNVSNFQLIRFNILTYILTDHTS